MGETNSLGLSGSGQLLHVVADPDAGLGAAHRGVVILGDILKNIYLKRGESMWVNY